MVWKVTPERAVQFTRRSMYLAFCWPPPRDSTKSQLQMLNILWWMSFLSSMALLGPLLISIYEFRGDALIVTKSTLFSLAVANFAIKIIVCRLNRQRTQVIFRIIDIFPLSLIISTYELYISSTFFSIIYYFKL